MTPIHIVALSAALLSATQLAAAEQRNCVFERQMSSEGTFNVNLPVAIARAGNRATVAVATSGQYPAKARSAGSSLEFRFSTPVSSEVIAVGSAGEAIWQIDFKDGRSMGYAGRCGKARG